MSEAPTDATRKLCYLGSPACLALDNAVLIISEALGEQCFLVGSCLTTPDFRDVDVRVIMDDDKYVTLFGTLNAGHLMPMWNLLCVSVSYYLAHATGLNIDFQVQKRGAVKQSDWDKCRMPISEFPHFAHPEWRKEPTEPTQAILETGEKK